MQISPTRSWTDHALRHGMKWAAAVFPAGHTLSDRVWHLRHRVIVTVVCLHAVGVPVLGVTLGHSVLFSVAAGVLVAFLGVLATASFLSRRGRAAVATAGLILSSALVVHLSHGYVEAHFHFFVVLAVIALYQDWMPFVLALALIVFDHGLIGTIAPALVYNHPDAQLHPWRWASIEGLFILAESAALLTYWRVNESVQLEARDSEVHIRQIIETALDAIVITDEGGRIIEWNSRAETMFGWTKVETIGRGIDSILRWPQESSERRMPWGNTRREATAVRRNGECFAVEVAMAVSEVGGSRLLTAFIQDITQRKRSEEEMKEAKEAAETANRAKSQFLANMSHEIRTPMNGVLGMVDLLLSTPLTAKQRRFAETVRQSGQNLLRIVNDILDLSKLEAGKLALDVANFDVRDTVEEVIDLVAERAQTKGLTLACDIEDEVPLTLRGDAGRLKQILVNLIGNAIKFTDRGDVIVRVAVDRDPNSASVDVPPTHCRLRVSVTDTGIGITAAAKAKIFEPFAQADGSTTRKYGGTGLGLAIVKQLVETMHGEVTVDSVFGRGSTFTCTVRLAYPASQPKQPVRRDDLSALRVLIVDGNRTTREILEHQLKAWRMQAAAAESGAEALAFLRYKASRGTPYHVAIVDWELPDMEAIALAKTIRDEPALAGLRIIVVTAVTIPDDGTFQRAGIDGVLEKPFRQSRLYDSIATIMGDARDGGEPAREDEQASTMAVPHAVVLLVEDNPVNQEVAMAMLEAFGCEADVAANGREALDALDRKPYDLVLMDCQMPVMDGFEATQAVRAREEAGMEHGQPRGHLPVVALTAHAIAGDRERCLLAGMDDYLCKPFTQRELSAILTKWLRPAPRVDRRGAVTDPCPNSTKPSASPDVSSSKKVEKIINFDPVDCRAWDSLRAVQQPGQPDLLAKVLSKYLEASEQLVTEIKVAVQCGDPDRLHRSTHSLKSSSATIGAYRLAELCKRGEQLGRAGQLATAAALVTAIESEHARVRSHVAKELQAASPWIVS